MNALYDYINELAPQLKPYIVDYAKQHLSKGRHNKSGDNMYICPYCKSGTGKNGTGAFSINTREYYFKCMVPNCGQTGNIFSLIGEIEGISEYPKQVQRAAELYNLWDPPTEKKATTPRAAAPMQTPQEEPTGEELPEGAPLPDEKELEKLVNNIAIGEYSPKKIYSYGTYIKVRFEAGKGDKTFRQYHYEGGKLKASIKGIRKHLYKPENITSAQEAGKPLYICEGEKDVETLEAIGLYATTSGSSSDTEIYTYNTTKDLLKDMQVIVLIDNDPPGVKIASTIEKELKEVCNMTFVNLCEPLKKINGDVTDFLEYYSKELDYFKNMDSEEKKTAAVELLESKVKELGKNTMQETPKTGADLLNEFITRITASRDFEPIPTGISSIDNITGGGFIRQTLVMLGAAPGMGKTALAQWIFENMAAAGKDVLYINLEMSRDQLLARSLSRLVWRCTEKDINGLDVLRGYCWTDEQRELITAAAEVYRRDIAPHFIYNPDGVDNTMTKIFEAMEAETARLKAQGKAAPLICIDYLQLIEGNKGGKDPIEKLKNVIADLKTFAIKNDTVIFLIVASNRASNKEGKTALEDMRDTSAIEYSGDLIMGLSYTAIEDRRQFEVGAKSSGEPIKRPYDLDEIRRLRKEAYEKKQEVPKVCNEISLQVLKNRFGASGRRVKLVFDGKHSIFNIIDHNGFELIENYPIELTPFADITARKGKGKK